MVGDPFGPFPFVGALASDSANNLGDFKRDDKINVKGSTNNDGVYTVDDAKPGNIITREKSITNEPAGAPVVLTKVI
jgi:hypothetical protein